VVADQRPVTIGACCPAAPAGVPVLTSFPRGGGPGCPHDQGARGQQPGGEQGQQVAAGAGEGRAPEPEADGPSGAKVVTAPPPSPGIRPLVPVVPGMPEVPVSVPGAPSVPVCPGVVPGDGAMILPLLVSEPQLAKASPSSRRCCRRRSPGPSATRRRR
jgi:hypothetical protein